MAVSLPLNLFLASSKGAAIATATLGCFLAVQLLPFAITRIALCPLLIAANVAVGQQKRHTIAICGL